MKESVVILLDALGTKGLWQREDPDNYIRRWERLRDDALSARELQDDIAKSLVQDGRSRVGVEWKMALFSDTIICSGIADVTRDLTLAERFWLLYFGSGIAMRLVGGGLGGGVRLRGAIALGRVALGSEIIVGPAIDEAAAWYERAKWIGVMLTESARNIVQEFCSTSPNMEHLCDFSHWAWWNVPLEEAVTVWTYAVGWPFVVDFGHWATNRAFAPEAREEFVESLADMKAGATDILQKYLNTIAFYDAFRQHNYDPQEPPGQRLLSGMI